jgi:hypothetical protein
VKVRKALNELLRVIADEADKNPDFERRIAAVLGLVGQPKRSAGPDTGMRSPTKAPGQRPKNRRPPPVMDPIEVARLGETALRTKLADLTVDQLRDIVAEFGMDPGKLVIKWKTADRIIERIVEISLARAQKGDAFRSEGNLRGDSDNITTPNELEYRGYRLVVIKDADGWRVQIRPGTATAMPPADITMKHSNKEGALANAKENLDLFVKGKWT